MRTTILALLVCGPLLCGRASAQLAPYNPYAKTDEDLSPVKADGKLNWPAFFKDKAMEDRFQGYFKIGACVKESRRPYLHRWRYLNCTGVPASTRSESLSASQFVSRTHPCELA